MGVTPTIDRDPRAPEPGDAGGLRDPSDGQDRWWLPPTVLLALSDSRREGGWWLLGEFAERRHGRVRGREELTDDIVGLTAHPWPLVDSEDGCASL